MKKIHITYMSKNMAKGTAKFMTNLIKTHEMKNYHNPAPMTIFASYPNFNEQVF